MLRQTSGYAVTALGCIASNNGEPLLVKEIAERTNLPKGYLGKIIHVLAQRGLVLTQRGIGGGVTLAADPKQLSLFDVCLALDDPIVLERCMLGSDRCSDERNCPCHAYWSKARLRTVEFLKATTIQDIAIFELRWEQKRLRERVAAEPVMDISNGILGNTGNQAASLATAKKAKPSHES